MKRIVLIAVILLGVGDRASAAQYWYYCDDSHAYFPYVTTCASQWKQVSVEAEQARQREEQARKQREATAQAEAKAKAAALAEAKAAGFSTVADYQAAQEAKRAKEAAEQQKAAAQAERERQAAAAEAQRQQQAAQEAKAARLAGYTDVVAYREARAEKQDMAHNAVSISYEDLARYPEQHSGQIIRTRGHVVQVIYTGGRAMLRVEITPIGYGLWKNVILCHYDAVSANAPRILEGDVVDLLGESTGMTSYDAVLGQTIQVPEVNIRFLDLLGHQG